MAIKKETRQTPIKQKETRQTPIKQKETKKKVIKQTFIKQKETKKVVKQLNYNRSIFVPLVVLIRLLPFFVLECSV